MKILISAFACRPHRGSELGTGWHTALQAARFNEVWVLTREVYRPAIEAEIQARPHGRIHFRYLEVPFWRLLRKRGPFYYYLWQLAAYGAGRRLQREIGFDVVHHVTFVRYWQPSLLANLPPPFLWGPVGGGESSPSSLRDDLGRYGRWFERLRDLVRWIGERDPLVVRTARRSVVGLATTTETAERLERLGCRDVRIFEAVGIETSSLTGDDAPDTPRETVRFLSVGRLLHWKGYHLALEAFARADMPASEYWMVGEGRDRDRLEELSRTLRLDDRVRFFGRVLREEALRRMGASDVFVHPSLHESGGWVVIEAMAMGLPVLCLALGGPAILVDDRSGIRVPPGRSAETVARLRQSMELLYRDARLRRRMGAAGAARVSANYDWDVKGERLNAIYHEIARPDVR